MRRKEDEDQSGDEMESPKEERSRWVGNRDDQEAVSPQGARRTFSRQAHERRRIRQDLLREAGMLLTSCRPAADPKRPQGKATPTEAG